MSTPSTIARKNADGSITSIYCHWDGDFYGVGKNLMEHYATPDRVDALIALGNLSMLSPKLEPKEGEEHSFFNKAKDVTIAYIRDRGDEDDLVNAVPRLTPKGEKCYRMEYNYLFKNGKWYYAKDDNKTFKILTEKMYE